MSTTVNAVFEGGGVRGIALAGAAAGAMDMGYRFDHVVGTSAGSLVASLVAAGYGPDELSRAVCSVDWPGLLDPVPGSQIPLVGRHLALLVHRGTYAGDELERVWSRLLAEQGVRSFRDLAPGSLTVVVTDISHACGVALPADLLRYGVHPASFSVARAVRMSSAVPFLFKPVPLHAGDPSERVLMADGAMAANVAIGLARRDRPVLGFRLVEDHAEHPHMEVTGPATLARAIVVSGIRARYSLPRVTQEGALVVDVPVAGDLDFDMSRQSARAAFEWGRAAAAAQLAGRATEAELAT